MVVGPDETTPAPPRFESGLHEATVGLITDYDSDMNGDMTMLDGVEVLSAEVTANFSLAAEAFESAKVWMGVLGLMIAAALIGGMDSRRKRKLGDAPLSA